MAPQFLEQLESRRLLAGVTLITHGRDGHLWGFNQAVADTITGRLGGPAQAPQYILKLTPDVNDGHLGPAITHVNGTGTPQTSSSGEIILLLDWTSVDKDINYPLTTVAAAATDVLLNSTIGGVRLAELPLHGISISRGTGLLDEISKSLGKSGVWVDQETYTDPNPVAANFDAPPTVYDNVAFVDNYWRWDGNPNNTSTNGKAVAGAYNLNIQWVNNYSNGWALQHLVPGGYYVGTIDLSTTNGGEGPIYPEWYGTTPDKPAREQTGFLYSGIVGGSRPLSGVWSASGGSGTRSATGQSGSQWANATDVTVTNGALFSVGQTIQVSYIHQDRDSASDVTLYLDNDRNPYNGNIKTLATQTFQASSAIAPGQASGTADVVAGTYWVCAKSTDAQGHARYAYSRQIVVSGGNGSTVYVSDLSPSSTTNGWGLYEKDRSNGESGPADGRTITLNGVTYAKGLGVHARSDLSFNLNKQYSQFTSDIGIDDEKGTGGSVVFQVYLDGVKAYDSGLMSGSTPTKTVNLNVSSATTLRLVVTDGGNGPDSDHADWAGARLASNNVQPPPPPPPTGETYLSSLSATSSSNGWGSYEKDLSNGEQGAGDGRVITLNGSSYTKGIGVHANSDITFNLAGQYTQFLSDIGVDDEVGNNGSVIFQVYLDGIKAFDSGVMTGTSATRAVNLNVQGKSTLRLVVTDAGNGGTFDHADWATARLAAGQPTPPPTAPSNLVAAYNSGTGKVDLSWSDSANDQTGFRIERKLGASGTYVAVTALPATTFTYYDSGPFSSSSTYVYRVIATNAAGNSEPSNEQSIATPVISGPKYLSDFVPTAASNGWGSYEKDRSNGESSAADGQTITLNGTTYAKGLGVHATSDLSFNLNKQYSQFTSDIGIDDEKTGGSVVFQVYLDNLKIYESGLMTGSTATKTVNLNVSGGTTLWLVVTDAGNGNDSDHADWANARLIP